MSDEEPPPVEIVPVEEDEYIAEREAGGDVHAWVRTVAAAIASLALVWVGFSISGMADSNDRLACLNEIQMTAFSPIGGGGGGGSGLQGPDVEESFAERAEDCGLTLMAEQIRASLAENEDD